MGERIALITGITKCGTMRAENIVALAMLETSKGRTHLQRRCIMSIVPQNPLRKHANQYTGHPLTTEQKREHQRLNMARWRAKNPERYRKKNREWEKKHPQRHLKSNRVRQWRSKGIELSYEQFLEMLTTQNYQCKICGGGIGTSSPVDHNHTTGKIRGVLCDRCNRGLGLMEDSISILERAIAHLKEGDNA